jgi:hypothetical protein
MRLPDLRILRLPFALVDRDWTVRRVLAADPSRPWREGRALLDRFEMSGPERRFARALLGRKRNLWLYRCDQRRFCGDFLCVDMSPRLALRPAAVLELKADAALTLGGGGAGVQFQNVPAAVRAAAAAGVIADSCEPTLVCGDGARVLDWLCGERGA